MTRLRRPPAGGRWFRQQRRGLGLTLQQEALLAHLA